MLPDSRSERHWFISKERYFTNELVKSKYSGLFESINALSDFNACEAFAVELYLIFSSFKYLLGGDFFMHARVLEIFHWCDKVEFFDIYKNV